jgi:hypothetical protein
VDLKTACEAVIALLAAPATAPLRSHLSAPAAQRAPPAAASAAFAAACARDVRGGAARARLYLADARAAGVLLGHVRERVKDEYPNPFPPDFLRHAFPTMPIPS